MSPSKSGRIAWATGSVIEVLKAKSFGPDAVRSSSVCKHPTNGRSSLRKPSKTGRKNSSSICFSISWSTKGDGAKEPMPSEIGPLSSSWHRLWSCVAAGTMLKFTPSLKAKMDTSAATSPPFATDDGGGDSGASAASKPSLRAKLWEKARESSSSAAACDGPKVGTPAARKASERPSWSNCWEPTTARTMERSRQKSLTSLKCGGVSGTSTRITGAACSRTDVPPSASSCSPFRWPCAVWLAMPALPGAT
mmetsp:Transcript_70072/g.200818  ORF Transcript_70072/g.200818 Transcript_70072/m.200818 type:complete len:250 (-) Transcript_70072:617-1366(-)